MVIRFCYSEFHVIEYNCDKPKEPFLISIFDFTYHFTCSKQYILFYRKEKLHGTLIVS